MFMRVMRQAAIQALHQFTVLIKMSMCVLLTSSGRHESYKK